MKKNRTFKLYLLVSFLTIAFVFIGVNFAHAQKAQVQKKPRETPDYTWSMTIPSESINVLGMLDENGNPHIYDDGSAKTNIRYKEYTRVKGTIHTRIEFSIDIASSIDWDEYVDIVDAIVEDPQPYEGTIPCGFPDNGDLTIGGGCLSYFFNGRHPRLEYDYINFHLTFLDNRLEDIGVGQTLSGNGLISILIWNDEVADYHSLHANCYNEDMNSDNSRYYIIRTGNDTWKFFIENQEFYLIEQYYSEEQVEIGNSGKYKTFIQPEMSQIAYTTLSFVLELTRHTK